MPNGSLYFLCHKENFFNTFAAGCIYLQDPHESPFLPSLGNSITCQAVELETGSNTQRMQQAFLDLKKLESSGFRVFRE